MFRSVLFVLCFFYTSGEKFSPKKARFCKIYCGEVKHSACECSSRDGRKEVGLLEVVQFRKLVVGVHNKYRNLVASGKETRGGVGAAADMMALSYSLELEFMVRCWGRSRFHGYYDSCRTMLNGREAGQNIAGDAWQDFTLELVEEQIRKWSVWRCTEYEQVKDMKPDIIDSYRPLKAEGIQINHFTAMVWGQADVIGCARIYTEDTVKASFINPTFHQSLICDYGITILRNDTKIKGVNIKGRPVYTKGKPCSMCPAEYKCNLNWTSLCGESKVPEDPAYVFDSPSSAKCAENARILVLIVVVLHSLF